MRTLLLIIILSFWGGYVYSQSVNKMLREGNKKYKEGNFDEAEVKYRKALEISPDYRATFNLGDALFKREQYADAINKFSDIVSRNPDPKTTSHAYHNIGNAHFKAGEYEKSLAAYRNSLRLNPNDEDTRYNYEMARRMIQVQQQQQQQNQDQNQQQQQQQNQDQNQQQQQQQQQQQNQDQNQQQQPRRQEISKEDAERILNALMKEEQNVQKKVNKRRGERRPIDKNW